MLSRRIGQCLRVAGDVLVGIIALRVALLAVRGEELTSDGIVVAGVVVVESCQRVGFLAGEGFGGAQRANLVARAAVGRPLAR
ncbi:MAG TPA: hypothetical protein VFV38_48680 [Ktedonobacteraceae bacterium]|nr:hypothetical protein [Ktedonobacteraceae bacterium]